MAAEYLSNETVYGNQFINEIEWSRQARVKVGGVEGTGPLTLSSSHHCLKTLLCWAGFGHILFSRVASLWDVLYGQFSLGSEDEKPTGMKSFASKLGGKSL